MNTHHPLAARLFLALAISSPLAAQAGDAEQGKAVDKQLQSAEAWARKFETALRKDRPKDVEGFLDLDAILAGVLDGVKVDNQAMLDGFEQGMRSSMGQASSTLWAQWRDSQPKFKKMLVVDGKPSARFRFSGDNGISIVDLRLVQAKGEWRIGDVYNHAFGLGMVAQMRSTAALMLKGLDAGVIARMFGAAEVSPKDGSRVADMARRLRQGDFKGAIAVHAKLSKKMRETPMVTALQLQAMSMIEGNEDDYVAALEAAAKRFPAPQFRLTLIDAHFLKERWDAGIACIDECMKAVDRDAVLLSLRAAMQLQAKRMQGAIADMNEAMSLEPDCEFALSTGLDIWLAAEDWKAVRDAIVKLEKTGNYDFKGAIGSEQWAGFRAAPESKPWR